MGMSIKILYRGESRVSSLLFSEFTEVMGIEYTTHLKFLTPKVARSIQLQCARAHAKGRFSQKQIWLGQYYSREIKEGIAPDVTIAWIDESIGYGVWANCDIARHSYIGEYTGVLRRPYFFKDRSNYYCFNYYIKMSYWECNIGEPYLIDAQKQGNFTRYINHTNQPNLSMISVYHGGLLHIIFYANTFIHKGSQLSYDYGPIYWEKRTPPAPLFNTPAFSLESRS